MDVNHLLHREGVERLRAHHAVCGEARAAHLGLATALRALIDGLRRARVAEAAAG